MDTKKTMWNIDQIDQNMKTNNMEDSSEMKWYSPKQSPFMIAGFPWFEKEKLYRRLPVKPKVSISKKLDILANFTAGGQIRFQTDSLKIAVKVKLAGAANMVHMPPTGQCGFDCYITMNGKQRYCGTTIFLPSTVRYDATLYETSEKKMKGVVINFPLYQGVEEVFVGIEEDAHIFPPLQYDIPGVIVFYGTSITQGGCASRPGMAYTNILSRRLNVQCINMGFSGNGLGESQMAYIIREIDNPTCIVLDYEANALEKLKETLSNFIYILREVHRNVPILVVSKIPYVKELFNKALYNRWLDLKEYQRNTVEELKANGDKNIYFLDGATLLGDNFDECTVDGVHPNDLGFMRMADSFELVLRKIVTGFNI